MLKKKKVFFCEIDVNLFTLEIISTLTNFIFRLEVKYLWKFKNVFGLMLPATGVKSATDLYEGFKSLYKLCKNI